MKMKLLAFGLLTLTVGCVSTKSPPPKIQYSEISIPELNKITEAYLGESLLMQAEGYYADSITISDLDAYSADIEGGVYYNIPNTIKYKSNKENTVVINNGYGNPLYKQDWVKFYKESNEICPSTGNCYDSSKVSISYKDKAEFVVKTRSFQRVIQYNGKSGNTLKFTYREFTDGMARGAFTSDFTMDMNEGDTIGYKGAVLKVLKANNNMISYSVIRNFNKT